MSDSPSETSEPAGPKKRSFFRDGVLVLFSQSTHFVLKILTGIVTYNVWGDAVVGKVRIAMSSVELVTVVGDLGMRKVLPYEFGKGEVDQKRLSRVAFTLWFLTALVMTLAAMAPFLIGGIFATTWWWGVVAALTIPSMLLTYYARGIALGLNRIGFFATLAWTNDVVTLALVILFGVILSFSSPEYGWIRIVCGVVGALSIAILCLRFFAQHAGLRLVADWSLMGSMIRRGLTFALGGVLMRLNYRIDIVLLGLGVYAIPSGEIGQYSIAAATAQIVWQIPISLGFIVIARGVRAKNQLRFAQSTARLARLAILTAGAAGAAMAVAAPYVLPFVYRNTEGVNEMHLYVWILTPGVIAFIAARLFESDLIARNAPWSINKVMLPVVIANVGLNLYLIPQNFYFGGVRGAALASTVTYTLGAIGMAVVYSKVTGLGLREIVTPRRDDLSVLLSKFRRGKKPPPTDQDDA